MMKCAILTIGYNAEKTIARTIESVLAQTGADWMYYLVDNGSEDATYEICCQYARQYDKIVLCREETNNGCLLKYYNRVLTEQPDVEGFCTVDADDALTPDFLRTAVPLMEKHESDLVILGTELIDSVTGNVSVSRAMPCEQVVSRKNFGEIFPQIHWFLRQLWCKLYRTSVMRSYEIRADKQVVYGLDTMLVLQFLSHADKIVLSPVCGYNYTLSPKSSSYWFRSGRYKDDQIVYQYTIDFLEQKVGYVSEKNRTFMLTVYYYSLRDTLRVAINADALSREKLEEIYGAYCNSITEELFRKGSAFLQLEDWQYQINAPVIAYVLAAASSFTQEETQMVADVFAQMNEQFAQMISRDHLKWVMVNAPKVVAEVVLHHFEDAFDVLWKQLFEGELPCCECTLLLGQRLSGVLSLEKEYAAFSKLLIEWYIEDGQKDCARRELTDWLLILPDDVELLELKEALEMS